MAYPVRKWLCLYRIMVCYIVEIPQEQRYYPRYKIIVLLL